MMDWIFHALKIGGKWSKHGKKLILVNNQFFLNCLKVPTRFTVDSQVLTQRKRLSAFASHFYRDFGYSRLKIYNRQNDQLCLVFNFVETMTSLYQLV